MTQVTGTRRPRGPVQVMNNSSNSSARIGATDPTDAADPTGRVTARATTRRSVLRGLAVTTAATTAAVCLPAATATAASAVRRPGSGAAGTYALTLVHLGRTGAPTAKFRTQLTALSGTEAGTSQLPYDESGTVTVQVPAGRYVMDSTITTEGSGDTGIDWLVQPRLDVDRDTTVVIDARAARPVDIRPPVTDATLETVGAFAEVTYAGTTGFVNVLTRSPDLRLAHLGPATESGAVRAWVDTYWSRPSGICLLGYTFRTDRALDGLVRHPAPSELATLVVRAAAPGSGTATGPATLAVSPSAGPSPTLARALPVPGSATYLLTPERGTFDIVYTAPSAPGTDSNNYFALGIPVTAGATTVHTFDTPVFGPTVDASPTARPLAQRTGNTLDVAVPLLADGDGHKPSAPLFTAATTTLYRDGTLVGTLRGAPGQASFPLPAGRASYRLVASATRARGSVTAAWTFTSAKTTAATEIPLSVVRFTPELGLDGTAPARRASQVGVTVRGAAERSGVRSLAVSVSTDQGATWNPVPVSGGRISFTTPAPGGTVSLRAELTDAFGNTVSQTHLDAYTTSGAPAAR